MACTSFSDSPEGDQPADHGDAQALLQRADDDEIGEVDAVIPLFFRFGHDLCAHVSC